LRKAFGPVEAVRGVDFAVAPGETVALLGPSGCGKSTVLRLVSGLVEPDAGELRWDGASLRGVPAYRRRFGMMFQDFALFPHLNVYDNVAFGLRMARRPPAEVGARVLELLALVGLSGFAGRDVAELSGGEKQRVALARALAPRPRLLMLDEPLGSLDRALRERLLAELAVLLKSAQQAVLYVTHDQEEAFAVGDRVVLMRAGTVAQVDTPLGLYRRPRSEFVARFLGMNNVLPAVLEAVEVGGGSAVAATALGRLPVAAGGGTLSPGPATVLLRPDGAALASPGAGGFRLDGVVESLSFRGSEVRATIVVAGAEPLTFHFRASEAPSAVGQRVHLQLLPDAIQVLDEPASGSGS
jgi:ABC-type Fe3+/spermidine/putrescine transport system ATPase subunit